MNFESNIFWVYHNSHHVFFIFTRISYIRQSHMSHHNSCHILLVILISLILRVDVIQTQSHRLKYSEALMRLEPPSTVPNSSPLYHLFASSLFSLRAVAYNVISFRSGKPRIYADSKARTTHRFVTKLVSKPPL